MTHRKPSVGNCKAQPAQSPADPGRSSESDFAHWLGEKTEALKFRLGEEFPVPSTALLAPSVHVETASQTLAQVLLEHEAPSPQFFQELVTLQNAAPLAEDELARQALEDGGADQDRSTPE
jgi:hypothetical protein